MTSENNLVTCGGDQIKRMGGLYVQDIHKTWGNERVLSARDQLEAASLTLSVQIALVMDKVE